MYGLGDLLLIKNLEYLVKKEGIVCFQKNIKDIQEIIKKYMTNQNGVPIISVHNTNYFKQHMKDYKKEDFYNTIRIGMPPHILKDYQYTNKPKIEVWKIGANIINKSIQPIITLKMNYLQKIINEKKLLI